MALSPCLLLLAVCGPAAAFLSGRQARQRAGNILTEQLFVVQELLEKVEAHSRRLEDWNAGALGERLAALGAGQRSSSEQLAEALRRMEGVESSAAVRSELSGLAATEVNTASALSALHTDLAGSLSGISASVAGLAGSQASQHEGTRAACRAGVQRPEAELHGLRTAVNATTTLAQRTEETLSDRLEEVDAQLRETGRQLGRIGRELSEERQARRATTTPAPTVDPLRHFLDSLNRSLAERLATERQ